MSVETDRARYQRLGRSVASAYENVLTAYISGSLVEGYGNPASDLDVFVVQSGPRRSGASTEGAPAGTDFSLTDHLISVDFHDDLSSDTEVWSVDDVSETAAELSRYDGRDWNDALAVDASRLELAHRLRVGVPVLHENEFRALRELFDWSRLTLVLRDRSLTFYNNSSDDAAGAIAAEDAMTALLMSRDALGAALDAYLASRGSTNPKPKWRWRKLLDVGEADVAATFRRVETAGALDDASLLTASRDRLRLAHQLAQRADG